MVSVAVEAWLPTTADSRPNVLRPQPGNRPKGMGGHVCKAIPSEDLQGSFHRWSLMVRKGPREEGNLFTWVPSPRREGLSSIHTIHSQVILKCFLDQAFQHGTRGRTQCFGFSRDQGSSIPKLRHPFGVTFSMKRRKRGGRNSPTPRCSKARSSDGMLLVSTYSKHSYHWERCHFPFDSVLLATC